MKDPEIAQRFWKLAALVAPPRVPVWTPGTLTFAQRLRQRAFRQGYKLDVSLSVAPAGGVTMALHIEPTPRVFGLNAPKSFARIGNALGRLGYAGGWDPCPGHAAANGTWRRTLRVLADANEEVGFVQGLGAALEDEALRRPQIGPAPGSPAVSAPSGWPLVEALHAQAVGALSPIASTFERSARTEVEGHRCRVTLTLSFLYGAMLESATSPLGDRDDANARHAAEVAVHLAVGRAKGEWLPASRNEESAYLVYAPLQSIEAAARFVEATDALR